MAKLYINDENELSRIEPEVYGHFSEHLGRCIYEGIFVGENYPWSIGLKRYGKNAHDFTLEIDALKKDAPIFIEEWPDFAGQGSLKKVNGIKTRAFVKISAQL